MKTSIIIRTKNEARWIGKVLERLYEQTEKDFEVVVVDSGSTDSTIDIVSKFPVKLVHVKPEEFTYPYALNVGVREAEAEKYLVLLSAHSLPKTTKWLEKGIYHLDHDPKAMGVYGQVLAMPDGTLWDRLFLGFFYLKERITIFPKRHIIIHEGGMGVLGFTNAIIRKELWDRYNFNEDFAQGGEDGDWAGYWFERGYHAIKSLDCIVHHSHYLNRKEWQEQWKHWASLTEPQPYKPLPYRKDGAHN